MKKLLAVLVVILAVLGGCSVEKQENPAFLDKKAPENEIEKYEKIFYDYTNSVMHTGIFINEVDYYLADLNDDGHYEILRTILYGSGIISSRIECYEVESNTFSAIDERMKRDYQFAVYNDEIYIVDTMCPLSSMFGEIRAYKPILLDNRMWYEEIDEELEKKVIDMAEYLDSPMFAQKDWKQRGWIELIEGVM